VLPKVTCRTIVRVAQLEVELDIIRSRGFAIDDEESGLDKRCIAAPVFDELGHCIAAISICGAKERLADQLLPKLSAITAQTAGEITRAVGGASPQGWL
jgi:IclR family acetate operon transcriptional repressor